MTLLEIMIVIFIIGIVGSVFSYNMKGSLEKGKAFKSEQGSRQVHDILTLAIAEGSLKLTETLDRDTVIRELDRSGLVKNPQKLIKDGWGVEYDISFGPDDEILVRSDRWLTFLRNKQKLKDEDIYEDYPWAIPKNSEA